MIGKRTGMLAGLPGALRVLSFGAALYCTAADVMADELLITLLRSGDPVEVRSLLGLNQSGMQVRSGHYRDYRTAGSGGQRHDLWQVVVSEGQTAYVTVGSAVSVLQVPWVELTRRGPVPHVSLAASERVHGIRVRAGRIKQGVEVQLDYVDGGAGPSGAAGDVSVAAATTLRGKPGQWLDAGGNLVLEDTSAGVRQYRAVGIDPRRFRLLVKVDAID